MAAPQPFWFTPRRAFTVDEGVTVVGLVKVDRDGALAVGSSRFTVREADGRAVKVQPDGFRLEGQRAAGPLVRVTLHEWIFGLAPGSYVAEWSLDGVEAEPLAFVVTERRPDAPDFWPPRLDFAGPRVGVAHEPDLLIRFSNPTERVLDLADALFGSRLIVDGVAHAHEGATWDGPSQLTAGEPAWRWLSFDDYAALPPPGPHRVQLEIGGARSNELSIK